MLILADISAIGGALIGVGGTVVGAATGIAGQLLIERKRAAREDERLAAERERAIRASARLMLQDFHSAKARLDELVSTGMWWPVEQELTFLVEMEDRRRLAARLGPDAFSDVVRAEVDFNKWQTQRVRQPGRPEIDMAVLDASMRRLDAAMKALYALAEVRSLDTP